MSPANDPLQSLFDAVLNGRADEKELRHLELLLAEDPDVVDAFVLYSQQEVDLRHLLKVTCVHSPPRLVSGAPPVARSSRVAQRSSNSPWWIAAVLASAAMLLISVGTIHFLASPHDPPRTRVADAAAAKPTEAPDAPLKPPAPVAVLAAESNAIWQGPKLFLGQSLREGDAVTLVKGEARISMGFGAEIAVKGPCALRIVSRDRVQLERGEVAVHVAEWAHGFTIETPEMDVVDLGTTFVVSASQGGRAETSVIEGQVRVSPRKKIEGRPRSVLVSQGEELTVGNAAHQLRVQPSPEDLKSYVNFGLEQPYRPIGLHNSGYGFAVGDEDPYWRVIKGPKGVISGSQFAIVCVPDERYMANDPESSQWVSMVNWRGALANTLYTFQTKFDLTGFDLSTVQLFGRMLADNGIKQVRVNGKPAILESWVDNAPGQKFSQPQFRTVNVSEGLVAGTNTIEIDVWNGVMQGTNNAKLPNPMALRVEWEGFGRPKFSTENKPTGDRAIEGKREAH